MSRLKKPFYLLCCLYILCALVCVGANTFSLTRSVSRRAWDQACSNITGTSLETDSTFSGCVDTADLRFGLHFTWVGWQFMSNGRGYDEAGYIPADVIVIAVAAGGVYVISRKKNKT